MQGPCELAERQSPLWAFPHGRRRPLSTAQWLICRRRGCLPSGRPWRAVCVCVGRGAGTPWETQPWIWKGPQWEHKARGHSLASVLSTVASSPGVWTPCGHLHVATRRGESGKLDGGGGRFWRLHLSSVRDLHWVTGDPELLLRICKEGLGRALSLSHIP